MWEGIAKPKCALFRSASSMSIWGHTSSRLLGFDFFRRFHREACRQDLVVLRVDGRVSVAGPRSPMPSTLLGTTLAPPRDARTTAPPPSGSNPANAWAADCGPALAGWGTGGGGPAATLAQPLPETAGAAVAVGWGTLPVEFSKPLVKNLWAPTAIERQNHSEHTTGDGRNK